jgi:hypothetical protein
VLYATPAGDNDGSQARPLCYPPAKQELHDVSSTVDHRALDDSMLLLKRSRAEVYMTHDLRAGDLSSAMAKVFQALVAAETIGCFGPAVTAGSAPWRDCGSVWRSDWMGGPAADDSPRLGHVFHEPIRTAVKNRSRLSVVALSTLPCTAMAEAQHALSLVGAATPIKFHRIGAEVVA